MSGKIFGKYIKICQKMKENIEYEIQVLNIDPKKKEKFTGIIFGHGGYIVHENTKLVRAAFHLPNKNNQNIEGYARVRSDGKETTMTIKTYENPKFPKETEVAIKGGFEEGINFLRALLGKEKAYIETYREKWYLPFPGVHEITFDTWPGLPQWMEIDCTSKEVLDEMIELFGINKNKTRYGAAGNKYELYYGIPQKVVDDETPSITFKNIRNEIFPLKNKDFFNKISEEQKNL